MKASTARYTHRDVPQAGARVDRLAQLLGDAAASDGNVPRYTMGSGILVLDTPSGGRFKVEVTEVS